MLSNGTDLEEIMMTLSKVMSYAISQLSGKTLKFVDLKSTLSSLSEL
jgi:hypothetical protein